MEIKEYKEKREELQKQINGLIDQFIKDNPYNHLKGKMIYLTEWSVKKKVFFVGLGRNHYGKVEILYKKIKKDGSPYADTYGAMLESIIEPIA